MLTAQKDLLLASDIQQEQSSPSISDSTSVAPTSSVSIEIFGKIKSIRNNFSPFRQTKDKADLPPNSNFGLSLLKKLSNNRLFGIEETRKTVSKYCSEKIASGKEKGYIKDVSIRTNAGALRGHYSEHDTK